jgi:hypothetical protein
MRLYDGMGLTQRDQGSEQSGSRFRVEGKTPDFITVGGEPPNLRKPNLLLDISF